MNLAVGQRWARINYNEHKFAMVMEVTEVVHENKSCNAKILQTTVDVVREGSMLYCSCLSKTEEPNTDWMYLEGQDAVV